MIKKSIRVRGKFLLQIRNPLHLFLLRRSCGDNGSLYSVVSREKKR